MGCSWYACLLLYLEIRLYSTEVLYAVSELQTVSTTIGILAACISVVIGVVNQILSNQRAEEQRTETQQTQQLTLETRQAQLFMQVYQRFNTTAMSRSLQRVLYVEDLDWDRYEDMQRKYGPQSEFWVAATAVGSYFGGLGVFVEQGLLDPTMIDDLMGEYIIAYWEKIAPAVREIRRHGNPRYGDKIEYLYTIMKQREQQRATPSP